MTPHAREKSTLFDPLLGVVDVMAALNASRGGVYALLRGGQLKALKLGVATRVRRSELLRFLASLPEAKYVDNSYSRRAAHEAAGASS
jgi:excisionase family DNA binding protein